MPFEKDEQHTLASLIERAKALMDVRRWREALAHLHQALPIAPENTEILCRISCTCYQLGEFEKALAFADRAVKSDTTYEWGYRLRSFALLRLGKKSEALAQAEEAVRLAPYAAEPFFALAEAQLANQLLNKAWETALRAREIAPEMPESHKA